MARATLTADTAAEERKIVETNQSAVFSNAYKEETTAALTAHIAQMKQDVILIDRELDESR